MPDVSGVQTWVWAVIGVSVVVLAVGGYFLFRYARYSVARRLVSSMVPKQEALEAARRGLEAVMKHLVEESDENLLEFAADPASVDRVALVEVEQRMRLLRDELDHMPLPEDVIPLATALADAAHVIAGEAGRIREDTDPDTALAELAEIDLARLTEQVGEAALVLKSMCEEYRIEDPTVYGGGLYI